MNLHSTSRPTMVSSLSQHKNPFRARGFEGTIDIEHGIAEDPVAMGFALAGVGSDPQVFKGFPVINARLTFAGDGYLGYFGWLQVIRQLTPDGIERDRSVDLPPFTADLDSPLAMFGYLPTFFDAPAWPDGPDGDWLAETFLVSVPDVARSRILEAHAAFGWGFRLDGGRPEVLPLNVLGPGAWLDVLPELRAAYPNWEFRPGFAA